MNKKANIKVMAIIFFMVISSVYFVRLASSQDANSNNASQQQGKIVKQLLEDKDKATGKPKIVLEWERATAKLADNIIRQLRAKGMKAQEITAELNRMASEQVANMFGIDKPEIVQQVVNEYSLSLLQTRSQAR